MRVLIRMTLPLLFCILFSFYSLAQPTIITTVAGSRLLGDGGFATSARLFSPSSAAVDSSGNLYIADGNSHRIRKVTPEGIISTVAGNGSSGFSGDGGPATSAELRLRDQASVAVDSAGNLFITDSENNRIRKVTPDGIISTVAGNGTSGFGGDGDLATYAALRYPTGVAVDSEGNLYIADQSNNRIRKVTPDGIINTVAGNGTSGFSGDGDLAVSAELYFPTGVAVDSAGNLYIADRQNHRIRKVTPGSIISTVAGGGEYGIGEGGAFDIGDGGFATSAPLRYPSGVAVDSAGNLYIADFGNVRIRKVTPAGIINTVAGNGSSGFIGDGGFATSAELNSPFSMAMDSSANLYIADTDNCRIRKVTPGGIISTVAGSGPFGYIGDGGPAIAAELFSPSSVAVDSSGNLYIAAVGNHLIRKVTPGGIISTVAGNGTEGYSGDGGPATEAQLRVPVSVAVDSSGNLYIADIYDHIIRKVTPGGIISTVAGSGSHGYSGDGGPATSAKLDYPMGVAVDSSGTLYIADINNSCIRKVTPDGIISTIAGGGMNGLNDGGPATSARVSPHGVAVDSAGNLYIADLGYIRIRKVTPDGIIHTVAGNGTVGYSGDGGPATSAQMYSPFGVAVDSADNLYIADQSNHRIRKVTPDGIINTFAGNGSYGYSGDGGPATSAELSSIMDVAVDSAGNLFIADGNNNCIRKVGTPNVFSNLDLSAKGIGQSSTLGINQTAQPGYATVVVNSGAAPYGTAVFSFNQDGVTVSEAGIPASPPTAAARIFIDYRSGVNAVPAHGDAGVVDINTGIAIVNFNTAAASVTYTLRNASGDIITTGYGTIDAGRHFSCFINQLTDVASGFNLPENFQTAVQFGTLDITSDQPLSVLALRGTFNQRNQFIMTTTPLADLAQSPGSGPLYFAQFVDGGGYTTSLILMNTSDANETGILQIMDDNGNAFAVNQVGGAFGSSFDYFIPPNGIYHFQTDGSPVDWKVGWVQLIPDIGTSTPVGSGVYGYNPGNVLITESGVPSAAAATHARIYVDRSGKHDTGLSIANINTMSANITVNAFRADGITAVGTSNGPLTLAAYGHSAQFADQLVAGLPDEFTGILDVNSTTPFAPLTVRSLYNESGDYLMTAFPVADMNQMPPLPIVFPQIADGGGYATQFILLGTNDASNTTIYYYDDSGASLNVGR